MTDVIKNENAVLVVPYPKNLYSYKDATGVLTVGIVKCLGT